MARHHVQNRDGTLWATMPTRQTVMDMAPMWHPLRLVSASALPRCKKLPVSVSDKYWGGILGHTQAARLVSLRMLDCNGSGSVADTVAALDWVAKRASKPAVVLLSLGIPVCLLLPMTVDNTHLIST